MFLLSVAKEKKKKRKLFNFTRWDLQMNGKINQYNSTLNGNLKCQLDGR